LLFPCVFPRIRGESLTLPYISLIPVRKIKKDKRKKKEKKKKEK